MMDGVSGPLVSHQYAELLLGVAFAGRLGERSRDQARRRIRAWWRRDACALGPTSPLRSMFDVGAAPLVGVLGFSARQPRETCHGALLAGTAASDALTLPLLVGAWGAPLDGIWSAVARESARLASAWVLCFNGRALRLCDGRNTFARGYLEFDLEALADHPAAMALFWGAMRAEALGTITPAIAGESARHGVAVSASLRNGVREALLLLLRGMLASGSRTSAASFDKARLAWTLDQAFTIVYRVLFLLFAESRSLVPTWHPLYRRSYTIEGLRRQAETPGSERGIWEALQAVSRLAHAGCHAGSLVVAPFNGRLFAPARAPLAETGHLDDRLVADALVALTTLASGGRRERVAFGDLGVEQLGAVYESVLDYQPEQRPGHAGLVTLVSKGEIRKSSGTFYTPRAITEYLVRHTLRPLVEGATADGILRLKVLDPAMGSGALLVAACRYLAAAYEAALVRERGCFASEIGESDRAGFRRLVAQHCLYGVDLNPMAVQLARLSMWLTTLARGRPLSFLDHRFVTGDSLVGATLEDVARQPPGGGRSRRAPGPLPLFEAADEAAAMRAVVPVRVRLAATPDDSAETVHDKERLLASTRAPASAMTALRGVADLWCACWFWAGTSLPQPGPAEFGDLAAALRSGGASLPERIARPRLDEARRIAERRRFLHWTLEFPEVFFDHDGAPLDAPGFDAILGNPPWEMVRGDTGDDEARGARRDSAALLTRFVRQSGVYKACVDGHANQYQLFVERSVSLLKRGGRLGLVVPWGLATDHGSAALRRLLFDRCATDAIVGFENSGGIFPIHRGVRFLLLSTSPGSATREVRCRLGERSPAVLDEADADSAPGTAGEPGVTLTPDLLRRLSGPGLAIPYIRRREELQLLERLVAAHPGVADERGWGARFGRELNRSDDEALFSRRKTGMPVVEGKHVDPFNVRLEECSLRIRSAGDLSRPALLDAVGRHRLAYRDVASATNRLTLISAIVPPGAVTVHTLYCLKDPMPLDDQIVLCGLLNSFVANFLVRFWVTTHLGSATVERLPVPRPAAASEAAGRLRELGRALLRAGGRDPSAAAEVQGLAAMLYGLSPAEFDLVLGSFPLVEAHLRAAAADCHRRLAARARPV